MERKVVRVSLDMPPLLRSAVKVAATHQSKSMRAFIVDTLIEKLETMRIPDYDNMKPLLEKVRQEEKALRHEGEW